MLRNATWVDRIKTVVAHVVMTTGLLAFVASPARSALQIYEGFDLGIASGESIVGRGSGYGFAPGVGWSLSNLDANDPLLVSGTARFQAAGLRYEAPDGTQLLTTGGSVAVEASDTWHALHRALSVPFVERPQTSWISFLWRWDDVPQGNPATLFWSPDGVWDRAAVGIDANAGASVTFINGQATTTPLQVGKTHWMVVRLARGDIVGANDVATLWIDPPATGPGLPSAEYHAQGPLDRVRDAHAWWWKFRGPGSGSYTLDEFRWGDQFQDVAPQAATCDLNGDQAIDAGDAGLMFANWSQAGLGDCHPDGIVDAADAGEMFAAWTGDTADPAPQHTLPEPHLSPTIGLLGLVLNRSRRRPR